jgi:hypothetical protein
VELKTETFQAENDAAAKAALDKRKKALAEASASPDDRLESGKHYIYSGFNESRISEGSWTLTYDVHLTKAATAANEASQSAYESIFDPD